MSVGRTYPVSVRPGLRVHEYEPAVVQAAEVLQADACFMRLNVRAPLERGVRQHCAVHEAGRDYLAEPLLHGVKANLIALRVQEVREEPKVIAYLCLWHHHSSTCLLHSRKQWR